MKVSLARQRSGCDLLFTGKTAESALIFIPSTGVTKKTINVPDKKTCSFYFGENLYAHYIGCDGAWKEISSNSVNESLEVTPGWNTSQLQLATRVNVSSFLLSNPGRIFRVAVQCRHLHNNTVDSTCVMFKVQGRIQCPIPQHTPLNQSATLPPPIVEITSTAAIPTRRTTTQAENVTAGTPAVVTTQVTTSKTDTPREDRKQQDCCSPDFPIKIKLLPG
ncbi:unnamed protein product [Porites lobata]|uniref:Uncharacterized protein n=1 Tax=Porites lobata TaxID=104759 RepID=A0ABN8RNT0_9CNID|nr:unnamed protein product [Porites lobata]